MDETFTDDIHTIIYKDFESEFLGSVRYIFVDDSQQDTYSIANAAFILKVGSEIEGIAKTVCGRNGLHDEKHAFDYDCIPKNKPKVETVALVGDIFHFQKVENTILHPLKKDEKKTGKEWKTYGWDNAYQNLKHGTLEDIKRYGTIKYMIRSLAVLYLLNYALTGKFLNSDFLCYVSGNKIVGKSFGLVWDRLIDLSDEQKAYLNSDV